MIHLSRRQAGDTIVEVLIAMAVISLVLVGAYVSTNSNITSTQDSQERSQAVELVQTEIEYLHKAGSITSGNCFVVNSSISPVSGTEVAPIPTPGSDPCTVTSSGTMASASAEPAYTMKITNPTAGTYAVSATWDSLSSGTVKDNITMYYQP